MCTFIVINFVEYLLIAKFTLKLKKILIFELVHCSAVTFKMYKPGESEFLNF